jgi:hypothetical protein
MAAKQTRLEKEDPVIYAKAYEIVERIKRGLRKKTSPTKLATELAQVLQELRKVK